MQPPLQPKYILRGHTAAIHSVCFVRENSRLLTGDSEGWVVMWDMSTRRAAAVWRAHKETILGLGAWGPAGIITHGRDSKLLVWQIRTENEARLSKTLPVDEAESNEDNHPRPWLLHSLAVNTLNFCSYASYQDPSNDALLVAVPGADEGSIVIYQLPDETIISRIATQSREKVGMIMTLSLFKRQGQLTVVAGFETGAATAWQQQADGKAWSQILSVKSHSQPMLSLAVAPDTSAFFSSGADAIVARHPLHGDNEYIIQTKHAGQQGLRVRSDGRILATAGWDGRGRVYSARKGMEELAVLRWHKEGCYAVAFAEILELSQEPREADGDGEATTTITQSTTNVSTVAQRRQIQVQNTHWIALGSKDGKVSLWDVF